MGDDDCPNRRRFCQVGAGLVAGALAGASAAEARTTVEGAAMPGRITSVTAKVISVKGTCGNGHKVGGVTTFTETGVEGPICIHALYSMLPGVFAMMYESRFPWLKDPDTKTHACPDAANPVVFEITRHRT